MARTVHCILVEREERGKRESIIYALYILYLPGPLQRISWGRTRSSSEKASTVESRVVNTVVSQDCFT